MQLSQRGSLAIGQHPHIETPDPALGGRVHQPLSRLMSSILKLHRCQSTMQSQHFRWPEGSSQPGGQTVGLRTSDKLFNLDPVLSPYFSSACFSQLSKHQVPPPLARFPTAASNSVLHTCWRCEAVSLDLQIAKLKVHYLA